VSKATEIKKEIAKYADSEKAKILQGFFKTGKGEYGEGDIFIGVKVPEVREIAKKFKETEFFEIEKLLKSKIHEERLCALLILIQKFEKTNEKEKQKIVDFYLANTKQINNWDLVDLSAPKIIGKHLVEKNRKIVYTLAKSKELWEKRIAIIATYAFIQKNDFSDTLKISELLINEEHDLMHKAVGWMLREIGKRNLNAEEKFLKKHYKKMPRTMLRYAIEKFDEPKRKAYLNGKI